MELTRDEGEPLGMHIKGGVDNPGNPLNKDDSGIFISKILPNGGKLQFNTTSPCLLIKTDMIQF